MSYKKVEVIWEKRYGEAHSPSVNQLPTSPNARWQLLTSSEHRVFYVL